MPNVARIVELLNAARVERVVHTGDITQAKTLRALAALDAPLYGVFGNNDVERDLLGAACAEHGHVFVDSPLRGEWAGHLPGYNRIGVLDLATLEAEILRF